MIQMPKGFLIFCFTSLLSLHAFAEAPVIDDSENFAILDDPQAAIEQPIAKSRYDDGEEEIALAQDNDIGNGNENVQLIDKLKGLQQELQELRGQLEMQAHELKLLKQQQLSFYKDIDARLRGGNSTAKNMPSSVTELSASQAVINKKPDISSESTNVHRDASQNNHPALGSNAALSNPADEQISYLAAYDLVKNKQFDDALVAMQRFVNRYPKGGYTANAQYWLGELYMVKKNYPDAIRHFEIVLNQFPSSSKTAACLLKIGYALASSGHTAEARQRLQQVVKNYPDTPTAELATAKLKSINTL